MRFPLFWCNKLDFNTATSASLFRNSKSKKWTFSTLHFWRGNCLFSLLFFFLSFFLPFFFHRTLPAKSFLLCTWERSHVFWKLQKWKRRVFFPCFLCLLIISLFSFSLIVSLLWIVCSEFVQTKHFDYDVFYYFFLYSNDSLSILLHSFHFKCFHGSLNPAKGACLLL